MMDKNDFTNELKELMASMSEEEIEKTITALKNCKTIVRKINDRDKGAKARLFSTTEHREATLRFVGKGKKEGIIKVFGASILTVEDFNNLSRSIPELNDPWWLDTKGLSSSNAWVDKHDVRYWAQENFCAKIRPILVIDQISGSLKKGENFYINDEKFKLISSVIAIKTVCLEDKCTFDVGKNESSSGKVIRFCVDGWYDHLIRENKDPQHNVPSEA